MKASRVKQTIWHAALAAALVLVSAARPTPAAAQYEAIGAVAGNAAAAQMRTACLQGMAAPTDMTEAASTAKTIILQHWAHASTAEKYDMAAEFQVPRHAELVIGAVGSKGEPLRAVTDPLAWPLINYLRATPVAFVRVGDSIDARGVWRVEKDGQAVGYYVADFRRALTSGWGLRRLEIVDGPAAPVVTAYCEVPGDIEAYQAAMAERAARRAARTAK
jgi:hypothetical protein